MTRYFGFLSLSLGLGLGGYLLYNQWQLTNHSPSQRFYLSWSKDITELKKAKLLPKQWNNIREVVFITPTPYTNE